MNRLRSAFMADASAGEVCSGIAFAGLCWSRGLFLLQEETGMKLCVQFVLLLLLDMNVIKRQDACFSL